TTRASLELVDRVHEVEVLRRAVGHLEDVTVHRDLYESLLETGRIAGELDRRGIGEVFALPAHRQLHEAGEDRGDDRQEDGQHEDDEDGDPGAPAVATAAAQPDAKEAAQEGVRDEGGAADEERARQREADGEVRTG